MDKPIVRLGAMIMIGVGLIVIAVSVRDVWRSSTTVAQAANSAGSVIAVPTAVSSWWPALLGSPVNDNVVVEVK